MAATVTLAERNGATPGADTFDIANINFGSIDSPELDPATYPITAGVGKHSFEKWLRAFVSAMGGSSQIDNMRCWISNLGGGYKAGEGISCNLKTAGYAPAVYATPVDTDSAVADQVMPVAEPGGPNVGLAGALAGTITVAPNYSDYIILQLDVSDLTPAGALNQKTITLQWDEL